MGNDIRGNEFSIPHIPGSGDSTAPAQESYSTANFLDLLCEGPIEGFPQEDLDGNSTVHAEHIYLDGSSLQGSRDSAIQPTPIKERVVPRGAHNYVHSNFEFRRGTGLQTPMSNSWDVLGVEIPYTGAANQLRTNPTKEVFAGYYNYNASDPVSQDIQIKDSTNKGLRVEAIKMTLSFPKGLFARNPNDGNIEYANCVVLVDIYSNPRSNPTGKVRRIQHAIMGYNTAKFETDLIIEIPGHWLDTTLGDRFAEDTIKVELRKITAFNENQYYEGNQVWVMDMHWIRWAKLTRNTFSYPFSAYMGMSINSKHFSSIPERAYELELKLIKLPSNYDPRTRVYSGLWDGTFKSADITNGITGKVVNTEILQWSDNPAWCYYDLVTNPRYGLGEYISEHLIDKWALYKIAKYCDELVYTGIGSKANATNYEPRYTCNMLISNREEAYNVIQTMTSVFRGMVYWNGNTLTAIQESPSEPIAHYNNSNVIDGIFTYSGASLKARHTAALIKWIDPKAGYEEKVEYVEDAEGIAHLGYREKEIVAVGCTSRSQAHRVGRWLLFSEKAETEAVAFKTSMQGLVALPGAVITIADTAKTQSRIGGRVLTATYNTLTFDTPTYINPALNLRLSVVTTIPQQEIRPDGVWENQNAGQIHTYPIVEYSSGPTDLHTTVTLANGNFAYVPVPGTVWFLESEISTENRYYKVLGVQQEEDNSYAVSAIEHYPDKYDIVEDYLDLEVEEPTAVTNTPATAENVQVTESLKKTNYGKIITQLEISWDAVDYSSGDYFNIFIRDVNSTGYNWVGANIHSTSLIVKDIEPSSYYIKIQGRNPLGLYGGISETGPWEILGKTAPPANVENFHAVIDGTQVSLSWGPVLDLDLDHYEIRVGGDWDTALLLATGIRSTRFSAPIQKDAQYVYLIKAVDTTGNYSLTAAAFTLNIAPPDNVYRFAVVQFRDRLDFTWRPVTSPNLIGYEIRVAASSSNRSWSSSNFIALVDATKYTLPYGARSSEPIYYLIKAKAVPGIYSEKAAFASTEVLAPNDMNLIKEQDEQSSGEPEGPDGVFGGIKKNAIFDSDTLLTIPNILQAEYYFNFDLSDELRTQTSIETEYSVEYSDDISWDEALFAWNSAEAERPWSREVPGEAVADVYHEIAFLTTALIEDEKDLFYMANNVISSKGITPAIVSDNLEYSAAGRFDNGLDVKDTTSLSYNLGTSSVPEEFAVNFWVNKVNWNNETSKLITFESTSEGKTLEVRYLPYIKSFKLYEKDGDNITSTISVELDIPVLSHDICIGISQSSTSRGLFVSNVNGTVSNFEITTEAPVSGGFDILKVA